MGGPGLPGVILNESAGLAGTDIPAAACRKGEARDRRLHAGSLTPEVGRRQLAWPPRLFDNPVTRCAPTSR
jgi:hypothetical protein